MNILRGAQRLLLFTSGVTNTERSNCSLLVLSQYNGNHLSYGLKKVLQSSQFLIYFFSSKIDEIMNLKTNRKPGLFIAKLKLILKQVSLIGLKMDQRYQNCLLQVYQITLRVFGRRVSDISLCRYNILFRFMLENSFGRLDYEFPDTCCNWLGLLDSRKICSEHSLSIGQSAYLKTQCGTCQNTFVGLMVGDNFEREKYIS